MKDGLTHVLLAENNDNERHFFKGVLENLRMKTVVQTVNDGDELLKYLSAPNAESPHIVFLGQKGPGNAGYEYLRQLKHLNATKDTAIAMYSSSASESEIENSFVEGANVYIKKTADSQVFKKKLENVLAMSWHYQTSGLNRDNFIMSV
ncbi:hypothetical protein MASR2M47_31910 [Draconibacterium sp.]|jgi:CheY-like chemotaxis protein